MNIILTPEQEQLVAHEMQSGRFNSPDEVIREGLRLLEERKARRLSELQGEIAVGVEQAERGQVKPFAAADLKRRVRGLAGQ